MTPFLQDKSWGAYIQQRFDLWNQLHITGAVRGDDHSSFGTDIDPTIYPKLSGSWTVTESAWDPGFIDDLQLRAAYGVAGNQPTTFSAIRTYEPTFGFNDGPGIRPFRPGNPLLKPERTSEIEGGFDVLAYGGRVSLEVTAFTQTTSDAILEREVAPSAGFSDVQVINVAEIRNKGFEISTTVRPIERSGLSWDLTFLLGHQINKIIDLAGINAGRRHQEGFSVGAEHDRMPIWSDIDPVTGVSSNPSCFVGEGGVRGPHRSLIFTQFTHPGTEIYGGKVVPCGEAPRTFIGNAGPNWQSSLSTTLRIGPNLLIYAMAEGWFDMMGTSSTTGARLRLFANDIRTHTLSETEPRLPRIPPGESREPLQYHGLHAKRLRQAPGGLGDLHTSLELGGTYRGVPSGLCAHRTQPVKDLDASRWERHARPGSRGSQQFDVLESWPPVRLPAAHAARNVASG